MARASRCQPPPGHRPLIGIKQPTDSSLTLRGGVLAGHGYTFEPTIEGLARDRHGIWCAVCVTATALSPTTPHSRYRRPDGHAGATAWACREVEESIDFVQIVLLGGDAARLGDGEIGIELPDLVSEHEEITVTISGVDGPTDATVVVRDEDGLTIDHPTVFYGDGSYRATFGPLSEGIYQVEVEAESAVSQRVW